MTMIKNVIAGMILISLVGCSDVNMPDFTVPTPTPRPTLAPTATPIYIDRQIREDLMVEMNTSQLIEAILQYPYFYEIRSYQRPQEGFDHFRFSYNGVFELLTREDRATALLNRYVNSSLETFDEWTADERDDHVSQIEFLEWILAQTEILEELTETQQQELLERIYDVYRLKLKDFENYDDRGLRTTTFLAARLWTVNDPERYETYLLRVPEMKDFNKTGLAWNMDFIIQAVWSYVTDAIGVEFSLDDLDTPTP